MVFVPQSTSRQIVRTGIARFFGGTTYDTASRSYRGNGPLQANGLSTVRAYAPKRVSDRDYVIGQTAGRGMGAFMEVCMPSDREIRRAFPAGSGKKRITYQVILSVFHLAHQNYAEDAEADVDLLAEAVKGLIQGDVTLGGVAYQAGESAAGIQVKIGPSQITKEITGTQFDVSLEAEVEITA